MSDPGPAPDPLAGRQRRLVTLLQAATLGAVAAAVATLVLPDRPGEVAGIVMVGILVAAPVVRVAWLAVRWFRRGDIRFGLAAVGLLVVVASGIALAV